MRTAFLPSEVIAIVGVSSDQLREWTARRRLLLPDVPAPCRGSSAKFFWETVLALRIVAQLRADFKVELEQQRQNIARLRERLDVPFHSLWGSTAVFTASDVTIVRSKDSSTLLVDAISVSLDQHLEVISESLEIDSRPPQLVLFPATRVK